MGESPSTKLSPYFAAYLLCDPGRATDLLSCDPE